MPLVVITGQKPVKKSKQGHFQIINVVEMMRPITKFSRQIVGPGLIPSFVRESFRHAEEERPGAAHLELPEDIAEEPALTAPLDRVKIRRPGPDPKAIETAASLIEEAKSPLILIAAAANRKRVRGQLEALIKKTKIPFVTTQMGKGVVDERSPCYLGTTALSEGDFPHRAIDTADLIISVGHDITEKPPAIMGYGKRKVIHVNFYQASIDDVYFPTHEVIGDIAHSLWALTERLKISAKWDFRYFEEIGTAFKSHLKEKAEDLGFPVKPQRLVSDLRAVVPDDGIITLDNGIYKIWVARNYPAYEQNTVLLDNALATMGAGLPAAMAAKIVNPDRKVIALCGDGGFMMNSQELETALRLGVDLTVVVINDGGYGMVKWKQEAMKYPAFGLDFKNPDFVRYAESYGARGLRVTDAGGFKRVLSGCLDAKGVNVIDCPVDYSENIRVLTEELSNRSTVARPDR
jgi:acetolactate synthase-1/2/3 large subunit